MTTEELIELLDQRYGNPLAPDCALIQAGIKELRRLNEKNHYDVQVHKDGKVTSLKVDK